MAFAPAAAPAKASVPTFGALPTNLTLVNAALLPNAWFPMLLTVPGIVTAIRPAPSNALAPIAVTRLPIDTVANLEA
jgi:hypothetical protein